MKEFPHQTTDDVTAAILLAILGLAVNSGTFENGMCAQMTGCFNIGDCESCVYWTMHHLDT